MTAAILRFRDAYRALERKQDPDAILEYVGAYESLATLATGTVRK